ncbi:hypothetical protein [Nocardioides bruguierae]|uniref:Uncharacterized protein n=1 Tax=Nocardioides bruguierae TaxID=2945102 RepID=A0A9X2IIA1_9ACTN|nr:hypothetical protein [Nocardioides bruguierae]MCM0622600.1 hypothetical protein [Nocardioides bruguierae]
MDTLTSGPAVLILAPMLVLTVLGVVDGIRAWWRRRRAKPRRATGARPATARTSLPPRGLRPAGHPAPGRRVVTGVTR